ncbi:hypothetical protein [Desulfosporosinus nitroreducens]|nr:hypothetical protein [Desulfosporosinus nitroreducens]MCO1604737.1 hypothetical protein [Desulfosporosinus nitroreducens]
MIWILDEPRTTVYEKLIDYALSKSDAFMLVLRRQFDCDINDFEFILLKQEEFENQMQYQKYLKSCEKSQKEMLIRAQIYKERKKPFLLKLQPYLIKVRHKPEEWPSTMCGDRSNKINFDINLYKVCREVRAHLLEPEGLFHWIYPYFPEDLCFFNDGYCWLSTSAHEGDAEIYTNNKDDVQVLKDLGLKFKYKDKEIKMFYEEY